MNTEKKSLFTLLKSFLKSFQGKTIIIIILFMSLSLGGYLFSSQNISQNILYKEKEDKLLGYARLLRDLLDKSYDEILIEKSASLLTRENQINVLNTELKARTDLVARSSEGLGVGYYSLELDSIITYGPSELFYNFVGTPIALNHPGRTVMATNTENCTFGTMVRGNILNAMVPIVKDGTVIGYCWATELTNDIEQQFRNMTNGVTIALIAGFIVILALAIYFSRAVFKDVNRIVEGTRILKTDLEYRLLPSKGELGIVVEGINSMAESINDSYKVQAALASAEASNKAQKEFLARMSHEIRTPMNGVLGMTRLAMQSKEEDKRSDYLKKIQSSASLLLGIINDILDFSKIEVGKLTLESQPFVIREIVENIRELIAPKMDEKNIELNITISDNTPKVLLGDSLRFSQVLLNILGNSAKFTLEGSASLIINSTIVTDKKVQLKVSVIDTGIGMSQEQLDNLFMPFTQADNSTARKFGGTGLGLSISKAIVELMGGKFMVTSEIGQGSNFSFEIILDIVKEEDLLTNMENDETDFVDYSGYKALLVEDNEINQEIALAVLGEFGFKLDLVVNGQEAVDAFLNNTYDLIFMDIQMPIMDGMTASREIRKLEFEQGWNKHIPIIAMTANAMQDDRTASKEAGMDAHISKPLDIKEIKTTLARIIKTITK
ncbi:MAG: response regulator [Bacillales bacterium]|jgi:signal transduction histidine kinase|nr:response regulator [Bacillales bacterium]